ncbi:MAG: hypothetical protein LBR95_02295 [Azoarcus sp.]|jgi:hypothetical protein|nr:hypothetical protein [Azoarcus sp.]
MKARPILFSAPMVRAILNSKKSMTRRAVKLDISGIVARGGKQWRIDDPNAVRACPYGNVSDQLWVRETWRVGAWSDGKIAVDYRADNHSRREWLNVRDKNQWRRLIEQSAQDAIGRHNGDRFVWDPGESPCRWRPSIHMPRWASRITLEITDIRIERLQDIIEDDAIAEGVGQIVLEILLGIQQCGECAAIDFDPVNEYRKLWESINGENSWDKNPWVWVVEFRRI